MGAAQALSLRRFAPRLSGMIPLAKGVIYDFAELIVNDYRNNGRKSM